MKHRQLALLFICHLIPPFVGMGLFPLLPLYAAQFGATRTAVGIYYAVVYLASAVGVFATSWLAERLPRRGLFVGTAMLGIPVLILMGQVTSFWQLVLLTALIWLCGTVTLTLINLFAGLATDNANRGKVFSLLFASFPIGSLIGGTVIGQLVARYGYSAMFAALGVFWAALPAIGFLSLKGWNNPSAAVHGATASMPRFGRSFYLLMLVSFLAATAVNSGRLGLSLSMQALGFAPSAIASTASISGLIAIPVALLMGGLSDRLGRARSLAFGVLLGVGGAALLGVAAQLWQFWLAATALLVAWCVMRAVASAYTADLLPPAALHRGLPLINVTDSIASILGFAGAGYVMDTFGGPSLYLIAVVLGVAGVGVLTLIPRRRQAALRTQIAGVPLPQAAHVVEAAQR